MSDRMMATVDSWILEYAASKGRHSALLCGVIPFFQDKKTLAQLGTSSLRNNFNILAALLEEGTTDGMLKSFTDYTFDSIRQLFVNINSLLLKQKRNSNFKQVQQAFQKLVLTTYRFILIEIVKDSIELDLDDFSEKVLNRSDKVSLSDSDARVLAEEVHAGFSLRNTVAEKGVDVLQQLGKKRGRQVSKQNALVSNLLEQGTKRKLSDSISSLEQKISLLSKSSHVIALEELYERFGEEDESNHVEEEEEEEEESRGRKIVKKAAAEIIEKENEGLEQFEDNVHVSDVEEFEDEEEEKVKEEKVVRSRRAKSQSKPIIEVDEEEDEEEEEEGGDVDVQVDHEDTEEEDEELEEISKKSKRKRTSGGKLRFADLAHQVSNLPTRLEPPRTISPAKRSQLSSSIDTSLGQERRRWTESEESLLIDGVKRFGRGKWKKILEHYNFNNRTEVNLKDKWRNMVKFGYVSFDGQEDD